MIKFRPETYDYNIFRSINHFNEYRLPERFYEDDIIIDIGAHIGNFTFACLYRGAGKTLAFEPDPENFRLAGSHFKDYGKRVELHPLAVWRSDLQDGILLPHSGYERKTSGINTGGGSLLFQRPAGDPNEETPNLVKTISFDQILRKYPAVRLVKLDCEGSEWPILLTSTLLYRVEAICGEYHEIGGAHDRFNTIPQIARVDGYERFTAKELEFFLRHHFAKVKIKPHEGSHLGLFWAEKPKANGGHPVTTITPQTAPDPMGFERNVPVFHENTIPYVFSSCLCCSQHFRMPLYAYWCKAIGEKPRFHRKQWEYVYICQVLQEHGLLAPEKTAVGFGVGKEPLVALFASRGVKVLASDLDVEGTRTPGLVSNNQPGNGRSQLNERGLCEPADFEKLVSCRNIDMNEMPDDLQTYDFCWSSGAVERLGSIRQGMDFLINSCKKLKPGGIAVHTTEFNLSSNDATLDNNKNFVCYRRCDIETLERELMLEGYWLKTVDYYSGHDPLDKHVDKPPYTSEPHLRLELSNYVATSIGLIIYKPDR